MAGWCERASQARRTRVDTVSDSVLPPPDAPATPRSRRRWWWVVVPVVVALGLAGASFVTIPYYAIAPGSAIDVRPLVDVEEGPEHDPEAGVHLTTVSLRRVTLLGALEGWLDPDIDVVEREVIVPPDIGDRELRDFNLELMADSKQKALGVAFEALGFDAVSGTGATIVQVVADSPAEGVLAAGEAIVGVDGEPVEVDHEAVRALGSRSPGDTVTLRVDPVEGEERDVTVTLGENPEVEGRPFLGVSLQTRDLSLDFPYEVDLESERIGGPSAGLAYALEVIDVLTPGELTGGRPVAVTGTIELDGSVGEVGGVVQKTAAVEDAGIGLFLVPMGELEQARAAAGDDLRVEGVETLDDALRILADVSGGNGLALPAEGNTTA
jgi:PDZ domain-containing protein